MFADSVDVAALAAMFCTFMSPSALEFYLWQIDSAKVLSKGETNDKQERRGKTQVCWGKADVKSEREERHK
jgi:hypothetical protein